MVSEAISRMPVTSYQICFRVAHIGVFSFKFPGENPLWTTDRMPYQALVSPDEVYSISKEINTPPPPKIFGYQKSVAAFGNIAPPLLIEKSTFGGNAQYQLSDKPINFANAALVSSPYSKEGAPKRKTVRLLSRNMFPAQRLGKYVI